MALAGHSLGGWTVLAVPEVDPRARSREVPAPYLAAEDDTPVPLDGVRELFGRASAPKRMFVLRRADHQHFVDDVEGEHEALRAMSMPRSRRAGWTRSRWMGRYGWPGGRCFPCGGSSRLICATPNVTASRIAPHGPATQTGQG